MKMKKILSLIIAGVITISVSACGKSTTEKTPVNSKSGEIKGKITVWSWDTACKTLQDASKNFKKKYPGVQIDFVNMDNASVYDKMSVALAGGKGLPDVVSIEDDHIKSYLNKFPEGFLDLTDIVTPMKDKFVESKIDAATMNGKIMAYPWDAAPSAIFYRKDIFKAAGVNIEDVKTWDDYIEAGKKILVNTNGKSKVISINEKSDDDVYRQFLNQLDAFYFDKDGNVTLNSDKSIKAMTLLKKMCDAGIVYNNDGWDSLMAGVLNGTVAAMPYGVWYAGSLLDQCPDQKGKWGVYEFPAFENGGSRAASLGGSSLMIPSTTQNKDLAIEFTKFAMTDHDSLIDGFTKYGEFPSYIPIYDDAIFNQGVDYFGGDKVWNVFAKIGKEIPAINYTSDFAETKDSVINAQARILLKNENITKTMNDLQVQVKNNLGK